MSKNDSESQGSSNRRTIFNFASTWVVRLLRVESAVLILLALYTAIAALVRSVSSTSGGYYGAYLQATQQDPENEGKWRQFENMTI